MKDGREINFQRSGLLVDNRCGLNDFAGRESVRRGAPGG
jgi:hypothetical protein